MTGIYQPPDPPIGPDRQSDAYPLTDLERALRQMLRGHGWVMRAPGGGPDLGPEQFASHEEYVAAAHEIWGEDL